MSTQPAWPFPPHAQIRDFLPKADHAALLEWTLAKEGKFKVAKIIDDDEGEKSMINPDVRIASTMRDLGQLRPLLEQRMWDALAEMERATGTKTRSSSIELELAAHGDGAHYAPHLDISYGEGRKKVGAQPGQDRILSGVYYFHREPRAFTGGALRIYRMNAKPKTEQVQSADFMDLEPLQNSLVVFPSWALHEVRPVHCPSAAFADYRFALSRSSSALSPGPRSVSPPSFR